MIYHLVLPTYLSISIIFIVNKGIGCVLSCNNGKFSFLHLILTKPCDHHAHLNVVLRFTKIKINCELKHQLYNNIKKLKEKVLI